MATYPGNTYDLITTDRGHPTFRHRSSGQLLHHVGPFFEARTLYGSLLLHKKDQKRLDPVVVWDVGMGCGFNVIDVYGLWAQGQVAPHIQVWSFDLETQGLATLLENKAPFSHEAHQGVWPIVEDVLVHGQALRQGPTPGATFEWFFVGGDFCQTVGSNTAPAPHFVFYDFFSAQVHPHLWQWSLFAQLKSRCLPTTLLATYATATAVRAALASAGFCIGFGPQCGQRAPTTQASPTFDMLPNPIPPQWKATFLRSGKPYINPNNKDECQKIKEAVCKHPQFL